MAADELQLLYSIALHGRAELSLAPDEYGGLLMVLLRMLEFMPGGSHAAPGEGRSKVTAPEARLVDSSPQGAEAAPARHEGAEDARLERGHVCKARRVPELALEARQKLADVAGVGFERLLGEASLARQVSEPAPDGVVEVAS